MDRIFFYEYGFLAGEKGLAPLVRELFEGKGRRSHAPSWVGWDAEFNEATPTSMTQVPISQLTESMCSIQHQLCQWLLASSVTLHFLHFSVLQDVLNAKCHKCPMTSLNKKGAKKKGKKMQYHNCKILLNASPLKLGETQTFGFNYSTSRS